MKEKARDTVENVRSTYQKPEDELESLPVTRREPVIPQYVPKTYSRETPSEPVSDGNSVYYVDDVVESVGNDVKCSVENSGEKKNNTVLWIVLAVAAAVIIAGCCCFSLIFALLRASLG